MVSVANSSTGAQWDAAVGTGLLRIGAGVALWRWRDELIPLTGGTTDDPLLRGLFRYFAVRDVALGVRTLAATRPGGDVPRVVTLQGVADTVDGAILAVLVRAGRLRGVQGWAGVGLAAGSAVLEYAAAWKLRRS